MAEAIPTLALPITGRPCTSPVAHVEGVFKGLPSFLSGNRKSMKEKSIAFNGLMEQADTLATGGRTIMLVAGRADRCCRHT